MTELSYYTSYNRVISESPDVQNTSYTKLPKLVTFTNMNDCQDCEISGNLIFLEILSKAWQL